LLLLGLYAGVLADLFDRRRLLMFLQTYAVVVALTLAVVTYLGKLDPTSLLMFTVAIGLASALTAPAWQAIQPEIVPREQIPAAATLSSVSVNIARVVGPAIGGVVVALAGPAAVFAINAVSFTAIIGVLLTWRRPKQIAPIERERVGQAIVTGLRVRARGLSIYLLVFTGAQAVGSYVFGLVATRTGLDHALIWSAILLGAATLSVPLLPLLPLPAGVTLGRSNAWPSPTVMFEPSPHDGPVLVTARYRVPPENLDPFVRAMGAVRQSRLRTGGHSWQLYHSPEDPEVVLERFTVLSWTEFQRQHTERWVDVDHDAFANAVSHTVDSTPSMQYFIALRLSQ
jgi:MFS family permease